MVRRALELEGASHEIGSRLGEYRCGVCGYGAFFRAHERLPACPMCRVRLWELADGGPSAQPAAPGRRSVRPLDPVRGPGPGR